MIHEGFSIRGRISFPVTALNRMESVMEMGLWGKDTGAGSGMRPRPHPPGCSPVVRGTIPPVPALLTLKEKRHKQSQQYESQGGSDDH